MRKTEEHVSLQKLLRQRVLRWIVVHTNSGRKERLAGIPGQSHHNGWINRGVGQAKESGRIDYLQKRKIRLRTAKASRKRNR